MYRAFAYVGGNWNNDLNCGPFYANLYNDATNSNTNIGAAQSYSVNPHLIMRYISLLNAVEGGALPAPPFPHRLVKINSVQAPVSI